jgi:arylsulfatase A-like enzyme
VDEFSLPEAFAATERGRHYGTALIGKWHLSMEPEDPNRHGWPYYAGADPTTDAGAIHDFFNWPKVVNGVVRTSKTYATTDVVDEAIGRIGEAESQGRPYFLWVAFNAAHSPYHKPPNHLHTRDALPATGASKREYYEAMVESIDTEVGRLLEVVDLSETTVIFLGDNGTPGGIIASPHDPEHAKLRVYEDGIRVPLLIAGAGVVEPGRTVDGLAQTVDLYPTILELAGIDLLPAIPPQTRIDGVSLMPYILNTMESVSVRRFAYSEQFRGGNYRNKFERTIRSERFKLIERAPDLGKPERELFNLQTDPLERTNLLERELGPAEQHSLEELDQAMSALLSTR